MYIKITHYNKVFFKQKNDREKKTIILYFRFVLENLSIYFDEDKYRTVK